MAGPLPWHLVAGSDVSVIDDRATAATQFMLVSGPPAPCAVVGLGSYLDDLMRTAAGWAIAGRQAQVAGGASERIVAIARAVAAGTA